MALFYIILPIFILRRYSVAEAIYRYASLNDEDTFTIQT